MSYSMLHGLGDCTPERHCGCLAPSVIDDARAETMARELLVQTLTANPDEAASESSWEWARRIVGRLLAAGRAETTTEATERIARQIARETAMTGRDALELVEAVQALQDAEMTTATTEDAACIDRAEVRRVLENEFWPFLAHDPHDPDRFWGQAVDAVMGLLATARTRPTREQIAQVVAKHDGKPAATTADAVLALLADQPTEAEVGARAVSEMGDWFMRQGFDRDVIAAGACYERAARLRGGAR